MTIFRSVADQEKAAQDFFAEHEARLALLPTISSDGEFFFLDIPGPEGRGKHTVKFPITAARELSRFLLARQRDSERATIGRNSAPTQQMVDLWLKADNQRKIEEAAKKQEELAKSLNVTVDELSTLIQW